MKSPTLQSASPHVCPQPVNRIPGLAGFLLFGGDRMVANLRTVDRDLAELTKRFHRAEERFDYEEAALLSGELDKLLELRTQLLLDLRTPLLGEGMDQP